MPLRSPCFPLASYCYIAPPVAHSVVALYVCYLVLLVPPEQQINYHIQYHIIICTPGAPALSEYAILEAFHPEMAEKNPKNILQRRYYQLLLMFRSPMVPIRKIDYVLGNNILPSISGRYTSNSLRKSLPNVNLTHQSALSDLPCSSTRYHEYALSEYITHTLVFHFIL